MSQAELKPTYLRIKRRRGDAVTDDLILATAAPRIDPKRLRLDEVLLQMSGMGVSAGSSCLPSMEPPQSAQRFTKKQRFRRVKTVEMSAFQVTSEQDLHHLFTTPSTANEDRSFTAALKPGPQASEYVNIHTSLPAETDSNKEELVPDGTLAMRSNARQISASARYKQVQQRRTIMMSGRGREMKLAGSNNESSGYALASLSSGFHLYDIVCTDVDEGVAASVREERKRLGKEQAALKAKQAAEEGTILMNYLPMVKEYLQAHNQELLLQSQEALTKGLPDDAIRSSIEPDIMQEDIPAECVDQGSNDEEFVYDVYCLAEEGEFDEAEGVPVVEVEDLDDPFLEAAADADHDSEDSNAESYYANSYPDDESSRDDEYEPEEDWCYVSRPMGGAASVNKSRNGLGAGNQYYPGGKRSTAAGERWDDEEYDITKEDLMYDHLASAAYNASEELPLHGIRLPAEHPLHHSTASRTKQQMQGVAIRKPANDTYSGGSSDRRNNTATYSGSKLEAGEWGHRIR
ncbi:hypothetical protein CEUSTIGMA_g5929.t1 [Chlamydomonas eustigma]|uniref:Probable RNA polymerase II nuclear localization protein SLC7A6OS n=1 Tax=Chlamydomonas eustigma TaxID=1157962 RepID=A0A250X6V3_9CHLO|nr:hypothetical protein CEUSTIGMA_g5929.t1 [Chlamydomonas eustigma]|eukprot:GAX78490.1 hypothetical protein CEUSTIGMA_g5929.t1 [Chlamydomonas eustigma]